MSEVDDTVANSVEDNPIVQNIAKYGPKAMWKTQQALGILGAGQPYQSGNAQSDDGEK